MVTSHSYKPASQHGVGDFAVPLPSQSRRAPQACRQQWRLAVSRGGDVAFTLRSCHFTGEHENSFVVNVNVLSMRFEFFTLPGEKQNRSVVEGGHPYGRERR